MERRGRKCGEDREGEWGGELREAGRKEKECVRERRGLKWKEKERSELGARERERERERKR